MVTSYIGCNQAVDVGCYVCPYIFYIWHAQLNYR